MKRELTRVFKQGFRLLWENPYIWLLVFLAILGDAWALLNYDPYSPTFPNLILLVAIYTFVLETGVLYALLRHANDKPCSFVDALMTAITSFGTLAGKVVLSIIPAIFFAMFIFFSGLLRVFLEDITITILFSILLMPLLWLLQVWTPFTSAGILVQHYSIAEAISHAWGLIVSHRKTIIQVALVFIIVDLLVIAALFFAGGISYESAFIYTVTEEMAEANRENLTGGSTTPGDYFAINRPVAGLLTASLRSRGIDLLTIPTFFVDKKMQGFILLVVSAVFLPVRLSVLSLVYNRWALPTHEFTKEEKDFWKLQIQSASEEEDDPA